MKIELFPEDMLLEYVGQLLEGVESPRIRHASHFKDFPANLEPSEEFARRWQGLVEPVVKKFIADTFSLHQFLFDFDGHVRKFSATDAEFWQTIDLQFSHRAIQRLYEHMLGRTTGEQPLYPIALPADALFISIALADFDQYSYAWFEKNNANWVVWTLFIAWQPTFAGKVAWKACFDRSRNVPLPARGYLYERAAAWFSCVNHLIRSMANGALPGDNDFYRLAAEKSGSGLPLRFIPSSSVAQVATFGRQLAQSIRGAHDQWTGPDAVALDDDRFLQGLFNSTGLASYLQDFEAVLRDYNDTRGLEERVNESVIFN